MLIVGSGGYRLQIPEGNVVGMQLLRVRATDKDIGPNGQVSRFKIWQLYSKIITTYNVRTTNLWIRIL